MVVYNYYILCRIETYCNNYAKLHYQSEFRKLDNLSPIVDTISCFDDLLVEKAHVSRRPSDSYYLTDNLVRVLHRSYFYICDYCVMFCYCHTTPHRTVLYCTLLYCSYYGLILQPTRPYSSLQGCLHFCAPEMSIAEMK